MKIRANLFKHQHDFVMDVTTKNIALVGGYACGKTHALAYKAILLSMLNVGHLGLVLSPIHAMNKNNVVPKFMEVLAECKIPYTYTASPYPKFILHFAFGSSPIVFHASENYLRIAGLNLAWFICDEVDTTERHLMHRVWKMLISRLRAIGAPNKQACCVSTPEGFKFLYDYFEKDIRDNPKLRKSRRLIRASTFDNPYLDPEYIEQMLESYPPNLVRAYLKGEFVTLEGNRTYSGFGDDNIIDTYKEPSGAVLHIGIDFNVGNMNAVIFIKDKKTITAVDEIQLKFAQANTYSMVKAIRFKYPNRKILLYPDATGRNRSTNTVDVNNTNHKILTDAGFNLIFNTAGNPPVEDRTVLINSKICDGNGNITFKVHERCVNLINSLNIRQNKKGLPEKDGVTDHGCDCMDYVIWYLFNHGNRFNQYSATKSLSKRHNILTQH